MAVSAVAFMWLRGPDWGNTGERYASNVTLAEDGSGSGLLIQWCSSPVYIGRVLRRKHDRALSPATFDNVCNQLEVGQ